MHSITTLFNIVKYKVYISMFALLCKITMTTNQKHTNSL